jgi:hypothetical protein
MPRPPPRTRAVRRRARARGRLASARCDAARKRRPRPKSARGRTGRATERPRARRRASSSRSRARTRRSPRARPLVPPAARCSRFAVLGGVLLALVVARETPLFGVRSIEVDGAAPGREPGRSGARGPRGDEPRRPRSRRRAQRRRRAPTVAGVSLRPRLSRTRCASPSSPSGPSRSSRRARTRSSSPTRAGDRAGPTHACRGSRGSGSRRTCRSSRGQPRHGDREGSRRGVDAARRVALIPGRVGHRCTTAERPADAPVCRSGLSLRPGAQRDVEQKLGRSPARVDPAGSRRGRADLDVRRARPARSRAGTSRPSGRGRGFDLQRALRVPLTLPTRSPYPGFESGDSALSHSSMRA